MSKKMNMLSILRRVETCHLQGWLQSSHEWKSLDIDYEEPYVERLYRSVELGGVNYRVCLHSIHQCDGWPLFHPHPWPSAVKILSGKYEQVTGFMVNGDPQILGSSVLQAPHEYSMTHPGALHSVRPLTPEVWTLMVMGPTYTGADRELATTGKLAEAAKPSYKLKEIEKTRVAAILRVFKELVEPIC